MKTSKRFGPTSRPILLAFLLLALANAFVVLFPRDASASCYYGFSYIRRFYSEPQKINQVGECDFGCGDTVYCSGTTTGYSQKTDFNSCPPICD